MKRYGWISGLILFVLLYALASGLCKKIYDRKLASCDKNPVETTFVCPRGEVHQLVLGIPNSSERPFAGRLTVVDVESGETVCDNAFTTDTTQGSNWLDGYNQSGYILTWRNVRWRENLKPKREFRATVQFDQRPPPGSSLWMVWVSSDLLSL